MRPTPSNNPPLSAIQSSYLKDVAYDEIRAAMMDLRLPPGAPISENWLVSLLGISKTPIRHALTRLERDGLVETIPFKGTFVAAARDEDAADIFELRAALEQVAARRLAARGKTDLTSLRDRARAVSESEAAGDHDLALDEIAGFHEHLIELAGNPWLIRAHETISGPLERLRMISGAAQHSVEDSTEEHLAIVEAIDAGDGERAAELIEQHLGRVLRLYHSMRDRPRSTDSSESQPAGPPSTPES